MSTSNNLKDPIWVLSQILAHADTFSARPSTLAPVLGCDRSNVGRMVNRIVGPHGFVWKNSRVLPKSSSAATTPTGNKRARAPTAATKANTPSSKRRKTIDTPRDDEVISVDDDTDVPDEAVKLEDGADFRGDEYWASRQDEDWAAGFDEL